MPRKPGPRTIPTCGHPDKKHHGKGMCYPCYYEANREKLIAAGKKDYSRNKRKAKEATWRNYLRREHGMSVEGYYQKFEDQGGVCAICKMPPLENEWLCVDHSHMTQLNRGLLHRSCNLKLSVLEQFGWLQKAQAYLREYGPRLGGVPVSWS